ncbi:SLC35E3 [Mytilus edulis]|uniref:SLC35E3 n=1 Tax=Mytilus edulis TaxID=6550 RepID=A0A8S3U6W1_MYTED|nr:SLC35E3 [Mytilus edulis]
MEKPTHTAVSLGLLANVCSSIAIILINKWIYTQYGFPNVTLTCIHLFVTSLGLFACERADVFQSKHLPLKKMLPLALTFCGFVAFTNLSLETNTVGTYQIMKTMTTPCIIIIQERFYARSFSTQVKLTMDTENDDLVTYGFNKCKGLKICSHNVNRLECKFDEIRYNLMSTPNPPDIIGYCETFLGKNTSDREIDIPGYILQRKDRQSDGGVAGLSI